MRRSIGLLLMTLLAGCGGSTGLTSSSSAAAAPPRSSATSSIAASPSSGAAAGSNVSAVASSQSAPSATLKTVKIGYPQPSAVLIPLWVAHDEGLFRKYGLDAQLTAIEPPNDVQALVAGELQFNDDGSAAVNARLGGSDVEYIAVTAPYFVLSLYAGPGIQKITDLIGKTVAVTSPGQTTDYAMRTLLGHEGISPNQVKITYTRAVPAVMAAVQTGTAQAGVLSAPTTLAARKAGLHEVVNIASLKLPTIHQGIQVQADWARRNAATVESFLKAYIEAIKLSRDNPQVAKTALEKYTKVNDKGMLDEAYDTFAPVWPAVPLVRDASIQNLLDFAQNSSGAKRKPADFYDNSYLQKLQDSFVKTLYPNGAP